ncbi:MAG TPA: hypothetical protein VFL04_03290, partial [Rectinemataceae bacterium]|nr:hypothetical protein [Rectinemataceae bacterium]
MAKAPAPGKDELAHWTGIEAGDFLSLTDPQSFAEGGAAGLDYRVREVRRISVPEATGRGELASYHIHELEREGSGSLYLVLVAAAGQFELRLYFSPSGFASGTRDRLVDLGQTWLFLPPPDPEDFLSSELEDAPYPDIPPVPEAGR